MSIFFRIIGPLLTKHRLNYIDYYMAPTTYKDAGVDIGKADGLIGQLRSRIQKTFHPHVLSSIGGFAALTEVPTNYRQPVLVSSTDGVGTKLRIAFNSGKHDTVGIDLVAMSANDILTVGARPFLFLDYFAAGKIDPSIYKQVVTGICDGCEIAGCALVGGETAEMPSFYEEGEYELAGFAVGLVEKDGIIDGSTISEGDVVVALPSSGLHSNGFSLVRKILFEDKKLQVTDSVAGIEGPLYQELLTPTRIYAKAVMKVLETSSVKGMAHITGGGLPGNISRIVPEGFMVELTLEPHRIPTIFKVLMSLGEVPRADMLATFNLGVGYVMVIDKALEKDVMSELRLAGEDPFVLGRITKASGAEKVSVLGF